MKRYFEFVGGSSSKFWEIDLEGNEHTVRYGRIGADGTKKTKTFASSEAAAKDAEKLIKAKTKKGYAEVEQAEPSSDLDADTLESHLAAIEADPTGAQRLVFGDWLQTQGHPWGSIIAVGSALAEASGDEAERLQGELDALLAEHGAELLGRFGREEGHAFTWDHGFIDVATLASDARGKRVKQQVKEFFGLPVARRVRKLVLKAVPGVFDTIRDWDNSHTNMVDPWGSVEKDLKSAPATLRAVDFGGEPTQGAAAYLQPADVADLVKVRPDVTEIALTTAGNNNQFKAFSAPNITSLAVRFADANNAALQALAKCELPALERLEVWLGGHSYSIIDDVHYPDWDDYDEDEGGASMYPDTFSAKDLDQLEVYDIDQDYSTANLGAFLKALKLPALKHLAIRGPLTGAGVVAIAEAALTRSLTSLDLSRCALGDRDVAVIVNQKANLEHLQLDFTRNNFGVPSAATVAKAFPEAAVEPQGFRDTDSFLFRYTATME